MSSLLAVFLAVTAVTTAEKGNLHDDERVVTSVDESKLVHWGEDAVGKSFRVTGGYGSGASSTGGVELVGSTLKVAGSAVYPGVIDMSPKAGGSSVGAFQRFGAGAGLYFYGADDMNLPGHYGLGAGWESLDQRIRRISPTLAEADPVFTSWRDSHTIVEAEGDPVFTAWKGSHTVVESEVDPLFSAWIGDELEGTNVFRAKADLVVYDGTPQSPTDDRLATTSGVNAAIGAHHDGTKRDLADNTCRETEFGEWSVPKSHEAVLSEPQPRWNGAEGEEWVWSAGSRTYVATGAENSAELDFHDPNPEVYDRFTSRREAVCVSNDAFVTWTPMTNAIARLAPVDATDPTFSNAVLAVGLGVDTNAVAILDDIAATFGGIPLDVGETATTVGGLLAALASAVVWLKRNKADKATTLAGYGITDAAKQTDLEALASKVDAANAALEEVA